MDKNKCLVILLQILLAMSCFNAGKEIVVEIGSVALILFK